MLSHLNIAAAATATKAGDTKPQVVAALRKAGVRDLPETSKPEASATDLPNGRMEKVQDENVDKQVYKNLGAFNIDSGDEDNVKTPQKPASEQAVVRDEVQRLARKKSVSFAEGTKTEDSNISRKRLPHPLFAKPRSTTPFSKIETIADVQAKTPEGQLNSLLHAESNILANEGVSISDEYIVSPVIPGNESSEEAALRRQMLHYNMQQIGSVVAEIELDEQGEGSTPPYSSDEDIDDDSSVEEEEDEHGRTKNIVFSDEYIKEMQALEKKLNASAIHNVGPNAITQSPITDKEREVNITSNTYDEHEGASLGIPAKGVRFAEDLDIQEVPAAKGTRNPLNDKAKISRVTKGSTSKRPPEKKKISRFKCGRTSSSNSDSGPTKPKMDAAAYNPVENDVTERSYSTAVPQFPPTPPPSQTPEHTTPRPPNQILAETILERPYSTTTDPESSPQEPDEFDPVLLKQEATMEYHRQRNRMIYRQGGFLPREDEDEDENIPLDVEGDIADKKVSRFMAARLGQR